MNICTTSFLLTLLTVSLCACNGVSPVDRADAIAYHAAFEEVYYQTKQFDLIGYSHLSYANRSLVIYIEGDGFAWKTISRPSTDPSPHLPLALELATLDPMPSVAYIARPGQFTGGVSSRNGDVSLWTSHRYSEDIIDSINQAIEMAKEQAGAQELHLVGYSGGGSIALLIAARRNDVLSIRTVAGNLNHALWTQLHNVSPLYGSLNPIVDAVGACRIRQVHYIGERDANITMPLAASYQKECPDSAIQIVPHATHNKGWEDAWPDLCAHFYGSS